MIQRKQTIWFLFASLWLFSTYLMPFASKNTATEHFEIFSSQIQKTVSAQTAVIAQFQWVGICYLIAAMLTLVVIFMFKNRSLQITLARLGIFLTTFCTILLGYEIKNLPQGFQNIQPQIGIAAPILAIVGLFFAIKGIKDDIKLLKSAERLR